MRQTGVERIASERRRQQHTEGFTAEHDDEEHCFGELSGAGCAYANLACRQIGSGMAEAEMTAPPGQTWRWDHKWWKPSADPLRNLEKAGALIAAEIDRILRERATP